MRLIKKVIIAAILLTLSFLYLRTTSLYSSKQLDHLEDRIRFGRLECKSSVNISVGDISISNIDKILYIRYKDQLVFKAQNQPFLKLMEAKGSIQGNGDSFYHIEDNIQRICKLQHIQSVQAFNQQEKVVIKGNFLDCQKSNYTVELIDDKQSQTLRVKTKVPELFQRVYLIFNHCSENQYYGLGAQYSYLNLGHDRPYSTFVREKGVGRTEQPLTLLANIQHGAGGSYFTSYSPMPIWFSSRKVAYILNGYNYMAWINNKMLVWGNQFETIFIKQDSYKGVVAKIAQVNGYTKQIPKWVNQGAILGLQGGTQAVMQKYKRLKDAGAKISGIWLQDWVSKRMSLGYSRLWWNWQLDNVHYKNWTQMANQLKQDGVNILLYINPMLSDASFKQNKKQNYYQTAIQQDYFVKDKDGKAFNISAVSDYQASLINFENPNAVQFFKDIIVRALNQTKANGMMVDFSEGYPVENMGSSIQQCAKKHNQYPTLYHQKVSQIIQQIRGQDNDFYIFTRAGYLKAPKYAHSLWAGDQAMNFNFHTGMPSCLTAILSSGLTGYSNTHCDIGGYTQIGNSIFQFSQRTQILMIRWMQLSAFTAVFRTHEGNNPDSSIQVYSNQYMRDNFAFYSRVFQALADYRYLQSDISAQQKLPLVRALFLQLDGLEGTQSIQDQFYLGQEIIVSPYMSASAQRKFFLPKGQWRSIWDGKIMKGCNCLRVWNQQFPAVLIRSSSKFANIIITTIQGLVSEYKQKIHKVAQVNKLEQEEF